MRTTGRERICLNGTGAVFTQGEKLRMNLAHIRAYPDFHRFEKFGPSCKVGTVF
jgi:hypothetical protein